MSIWDGTTEFREAKTDEVGSLVAPFCLKCKRVYSRADHPDRICWDCGGEIEWCDAEGRYTPAGHPWPAKGGIVAAAEFGLLAGWFGEWPTEPGQYLFYGMRRGDLSEKRLRLRLVTVALDSTGRPARFTDGEFFYQSEQYGLFKKVSEELPSEAAIHRFAAQ